MEFLKDWDDLTHGTAVFSAAIPFVLAFALSFRVPARFRWLLVALAVVPVAYWLFKVPTLPPTSSDHVTAAALRVAVFLLLLESVSPGRGRWPLWLLLRSGVFFALAWSVYPAWLATDEYSKHKLLICAGFGVSVGCWSVAIECLCGRGCGDRFSLTPAALIPPTIALAVLLQTGGSMQFAQVLGALAAGVSAICLAMLLRPVADDRSAGKIGALWGMLFLVLGWSGWLFAEIRYGLAALLLLAPLAAALASLVPFLPRRNPFLCLLWDFLAAGLVAFPVAAVAAIKYAEEMAEFEGY